METRETQRLEGLIQILADGSNGSLGLAEAERRLYERQITMLETRCNTLQDEVALLSASLEERNECRDMPIRATNASWPAADLIKCLQQTQMAFLPISSRLSESLEHIERLQKENLALRCSIVGSKDWAAMKIQKCWRGWLAQHNLEDRQYDAGLVVSDEFETGSFEKGRTTTLSASPNTPVGDEWPGPRSPSIEQRQKTVTLDFLHKDNKINTSPIPDLDKDIERHSDASSRDFVLNSPDFRGSSSTAPSSPESASPLMASPTFNRSRPPMYPFADTAPSSLMLHGALTKSPVLPKQKPRVSFSHTAPSLMLRGSLVDQRNAGTQDRYGTIRTSIERRHWLSNVSRKAATHRRARTMTNPPMLESSSEVESAYESFSSSSDSPISQTQHSMAKNRVSGGARSLQSWWSTPDASTPCQTPTSGVEKGQIWAWQSSMEAARKRSSRHFRQLSALQMLEESNAFVKIDI